jgi:signal transduction histidine kinase
MASLRRRALAGGIAFAVAVFVLGGVAILLVFERIALSRFDTALVERHRQVVAAVAAAGGAPAGIRDPAYDRPLSGRYWQVTGPDGTVATSPSLFDAVLQLPDAPPPDAPQPALWTGPGPEGPAAPVRGVVRSVVLEDGGHWTVAVAVDLSGLAEDRQDMRRSLGATLALLGLTGVAGALALISAVLAPLSRLRAEVARRWDDAGGARIDPAPYPDEVAPLVDDLNRLIDRSRETLDRSRRQAADLAHALKTPSAVLHNALQDLRAQGADVETAEDALARIDAQVARSLARQRAAHAAAGVGVRVDLSDAMGRLARLFAGLSDRAGKRFETGPVPAADVPVDRQDLEEMVGNLLDNAVKWARGRIALSCAVDPADVRITVEDDGPGIPEGARRDALRSGMRLDTAVPGTGLGLAIASDLAQAYGGALDLGQSARLGGLAATVTLPRRRV